MTAPFFMLLRFIGELDHLDTAQALIDETRSVTPTEHVLQLELDRRQTELHLRRARINMMMLDIRSRN